MMCVFFTIVKQNSDDGSKTKTITNALEKGYA
jgi:hypothetical protein